MAAGAGAAGGGGGGEEEGGSRHAVRYASCALEEEVFLHPRSALHKVCGWVGGVGRPFVCLLPPPSSYLLPLRLEAISPDRPPPLLTYLQAAPQFVVYTQLVRTVKRPYMAGVSTIEVWGDWEGG